MCVTTTTTSPTVFGLAIVERLNDLPVETVNANTRAKQVKTDSIDSVYQKSLHMAHSSY